MPGLDSPVSGKPVPTSVQVAPSSSEKRPRSLPSDANICSVMPSCAPAGSAALFW